MLDEPVAGLDPKGKTEFFRLLHALHGGFVKTIVIVSHDMDNVAEHCTRAAVFDKGEIYRVAPPKELFRDAAALTAMGLDVPVTGYLAAQLKAAGVFVDTDFTVADFAEKTLEKWRERQ